MADLGCAAGMPRSLWGWGLTERRPALDTVAARALPMFGTLTPEEPVPDEVALAALQAPRVPVPADLAGFASADAHERASHARGKAYPDRVRGFQGDHGSAPDLVARPRDEAELVRVLAACEAHKLAAVPFGGGSSVVGGVEPRLGPGHNGAVSIDLAALDRVLEIDDVSRSARIQGGVFGPALEQQLGAQGYSLRHFPQSFEFSTLGGWIATRAGGHYATLHTHIDDLVQSVRMLTPRGLWQSARLPASGAGPDPNRLVCGSEGILGVITEAWMRIVPRPVYRASASVHFTDFDAAVAATREVAQSGLHPANCRLLDAREAMVTGVAADNVLLLGFESADHPLGPWLERALAIATSHGGSCPRGPKLRDDRDKARAPGDDAAESWRKSFLDGPYLQDGLLCLGIIADTFETACTWRAFPELFRAVTAAMNDILQRVCGGGVLSCRFTHVYPDGPAPYFTFLGRARRGAELEQWAELKQAAGDALSAAGGTITHHHAVGRTHRPWYDRERPQPFAEALRAAKRALDPAGILNPGVLID